MQASRQASRFDGSKGCGNECTRECIEIKDTGERRECMCFLCGCQKGGANKVENEAIKRDP